jgi:hypothetical protein
VNSILSLRALAAQSSAAAQQFLTALQSELPPLVERRKLVLLGSGFANFQRTD